MKRAIQVQVRMPNELVKDIDRWVAKGRFASRSDAVKTILALHLDRERTREFHEMLLRRSEEVRRKPGSLVPLEEVQ